MAEIVNNKEGLPLPYYSGKFREADPLEITARTGVPYDEDRRIFTFTLMNSVYEIKTLKIAVMLSHDWNPNTLAAFQRAVPELQNAGYVFLPLFSRSWTIGNTTILFS